MVRALDEETYREDFVKRMSREARITYLRDVLDYPDDDPMGAVDDTLVDIIKGGPEPDDYAFDEDAAREAIQEGALEVSVRSSWYAPGHPAPSPDEFMILLALEAPPCASSASWTSTSNQSLRRSSIRTGIPRGLS
jgi:hypothetical protein